MVFFIITQINHSEKNLYNTLKEFSMHTVKNYQFEKNSLSKSSELKLSFSNSVIF